MPRLVLALVALVALIYLGICAALFVFQRSLLYYPQPRTLVAGTRTLLLPVDGGDVLVTTRDQPGPKAVVYFGGNAEDATSQLPVLVAAFPDHAIYLMHYRGYGGSVGEPSEAALVADALLLFDRIVADHGTITVVGRSLGSGIAIHLASLRPVRRLFLVTPYDSIAEIAAGQYPYVPVGLLLRDRYDSWKYAPQVVAPTLLIAAERDLVIPRASTEALLGRFRPGVASRVVIDGASHDDVVARPEFVAALESLP